MSDTRDQLVQSALGQHPVDTAGAAIGVCHLAPDRSYVGVPELLKAYVDEDDHDAWEKIAAKIDYTYASLDLALVPLSAETGFAHEVKARVSRGQTLLFKPNLVNIFSIDPDTHGRGVGNTACTDWSFVAALMRWFHDRLGIRYHQMALGEAATTMALAAAELSLLHPQGRRVTPEAAIEGKVGSAYGGWGFYFVRRYLAARLDPSATDDPFLGYEESLAGAYLPPGRAGERLMVYDLNRLSDDPSKGRRVPVADGANFQSITVHKVIVGGDPADPEDRAAYPGCVLVNVPKLKVHSVALLTNALKNLGIGLYPMESRADGQSRWQYSFAPDDLPTIKGNIPHQVWVPEIDPRTRLPRRNGTGEYVLRETAGLAGTMVDIVKAVNDQGVYALHVVDAVETTNVEHGGSAVAPKIPEGLVFAGLDPVATDLLCARFLFSNVPLTEALHVDLDDGHGGRFPQRVPVPTLENGKLVTREGYDCPIARDRTFHYAESRGLGRRQYHVVGADAASGDPLVSLRGHLGAVRDGAFHELVTSTLYFAAFKMPWDLQKTVLAYLAATDALAGSTLRQEFLEAMDENGDGVVDYQEMGRKGLPTFHMNLIGLTAPVRTREPLGYLRAGYEMGALMLKYRGREWNGEGHEAYKEAALGAVAAAALTMSMAPSDLPDPFVPSLTWGNGHWPSFSLASYLQVGSFLYGVEFPRAVGLLGLYGSAFRYADATQNWSGYSGMSRTVPNPEALVKYRAALAKGEAPLRFTVYVPAGYGTVGSLAVPNVEETSDPARVFTAEFEGGREVWADLRRR